MPDPETNGLRILGSEGPMLNATALRSTKAGLLALGIVSFALATFGPWFNLLLGYGLMAASVAVAVRARPGGRFLRDRRTADPAPHPSERDAGRDSADRRLRTGRDHQGILQPERRTEARADRVPPRERPRPDHGPSNENRKRHVRLLDAEPNGCPERVSRGDRGGPGRGPRPVRSTARRLLDRGDDPTERGPNDHHDAGDAAHEEGRLLRIHIPLVHRRARQPLIP